jgi:hypothetical protein
MPSLFTSIAPAHAYTHVCAGFLSHVHTTCPCMHMHVRTGAWVRTSTCTLGGAHTHTHTHTHAHAHVLVHAHAHVHVCSTSMCKHAYMKTRTCPPHTHACVCRQIYMCACTNMHTRMDAHKCVPVCNEHRLCAKVLPQKARVLPGHHPPCGILYKSGGTKHQIRAPCYRLVICFLPSRVSPADTNTLG